LNIKIFFLAIVATLLSYPTTSPADTADIIFTGGNIVTSNIHRPEVEALAVTDGKISAIGDLEDVLALQGKNTQMIPLNGRALLPGFVGAHTHPIYYNRSRMSQFSVRPGEFKNFDDMIDALKKEAKKGDVVAWGYDGSLINGARELGFKELDKVSSKNSVIVLGLSSHEAYGNHIAFEQAGITNETKNPIGGSLVRDKQGNLTGAGLEIPGVALVLKGDKTKTNFEDIVKESLNNYAQNGFTTITITGLGVPLPTPEKHFSLIKNAAMAKDSPVRVQGYVVSEWVDKIPALMKNNNDHFRVLGMKIWVDGSIQGHTALLKDKYADRDIYGKANYTQKMYNDIVLKAHKMGLQIASHSNGDAAVEMTFKAYAAAQKAYPRKDARHRIEHFTVTDRDSLKRAKDLGVTPTFLNQHVYEWGQVFIKRLGEKRASTVDPAGSAERLGMNFSFHDDAPTGLPQPLKMIQIAVTREMRMGGVLNADERIPIDRAIRAVTIDPAWQSFIENTRGSLDIGKYADLVILSSNPRKADSKNIMHIKVLETWLQGRRIVITDQSLPPQSHSHEGQK
jgi:predicted amidohydrolase YtcJ